eukprot:gene24332-biopygen1357
MGCLCVTSSLRLFGEKALRVCTALKTHGTPPFFGRHCFGREYNKDAACNSAWRTVVVESVVVRPNELPASDRGVRRQAARPTRWTLPLRPGGTGHWRGRGAGKRHFFGLGWRGRGAGTARAWRGHPLPRGKDLLPPLHHHTSRGHASGSRGATAHTTT